MLNRARPIMRLTVLTAAVCLSILAASAAWAEGPTITVDLGHGGRGQIAVVIQILALLTVLSLAPAIVVMMTSCTRIVIVLSFLRQALGAQQVPPNQVLVSLALFLTMFVMAPVATAVYQDALQPLMAERIGYEEAWSKGSSPLRAFMLKQVREKDLALFADLAKLPAPAAPADLPMHVVTASFMLSELRVAFQIGFLVYIPFLVIDMVVASVLMSMGMMLLPPVVISMPFKLILFVLADGWYLIVGSLVRSFQ
jgi:flagellar biosynthetic protein FliP